MTRTLAFAVSLFILLCPVLSFQFQLPPVHAVNGDPVHNLNTKLNYTTIQQAIDAVDTDVGHVSYLQ